jgi:hypothetical protein
MIFASGKIVIDIELSALGDIEMRETADSESERKLR